MKRFSNALRSIRTQGRTEAAALQTLVSFTPLSESKRGIRNLHQYPHARYKSLVKDTQRFARNWWLSAGNNHELVSEVGHEREATENFGVYRDDSSKDKYNLFTNRLADLPPAARLDAIVTIMEKRWKVKDGNRGFDKAKLLLEALECFSEMRLSGQIKVFDELPEPEQDTFLQYVEGCLKFSQSCSHSHPDAAAIVIRAAQICDEMRCEDKRDEALQVAEGVTKRIDRAYAFARPTQRKVQLTPPSIDEVHKRARVEQLAFLQERFKDKPHVLKGKERVDFFYGSRSRRIYHRPMRHNDWHKRLVVTPSEADQQRSLS